jgi:hypothetical protein
MRPAVIQTTAQPSIEFSAAGCTSGLTTATGEFDTLSRRYTFAASLVTMIHCQNNSKENP